MRSASLLVALGTVMIAGAGPGRAQDAPPPPPPPVENRGGERPEKPDRDRPREDGDGDRERFRNGPRPGGNMPGSPGGQGGPGGYSGGGFSRGGDRERGDMFKGLPEEDRQRVRDAFEKAWSDPEVIAARERLAKANEEMRTSLHNALKNADPEVVKILEKVRPPGGGGGPGFARMPSPDDPNFAREAVARLGGELQWWARMERREGPTGPMHEKILQAPNVRAAIERAQSAGAEQRGDAWKQLREAYLGAAKAEFTAAWGKSPWDPGREREREREKERGPGPPPSANFGSGGDRVQGPQQPPPPSRPDGEVPRPLEGESKPKPPGE